MPLSSYGSESCSRQVFTDRLQQSACSGYRPGRVGIAASQRLSPHFLDTVGTHRQQRIGDHRVCGSTGVLFQQGEERIEFFAKQFAALRVGRAFGFENSPEFFERSTSPDEGGGFGFEESVRWIIGLLLDFRVSRIGGELK